jgi:phospholipid-binding lipoprotein MlaA
MPLAHAADDGDPWEGFNRKIMAFNDAADRWVMKPVARGYTKVVPRPARRGVSNFFSNLLYPIVIVNQFLQGKFRDGVSDIGRFVVNTTVGLGGLLDPATAVGLPRNDEDFGQTFGKWGAGPGPYIVVPFLGPSTIRDGTGSLCSAALTPWRYSDEERVRYGATALYAIDARAGLLEAEELISGDRYSFLRDAYLQRREFLVQDGEVEDDFMDESWDEEAVEE